MILYNLCMVEKFYCLYAAKCLIVDVSSISNFFIHLEYFCCICKVLE